MLAQLSRAAARTAPVVRRAPLRCLSAVRAIDPSIEAAPEGSELAAWRTQIAPAIGRAYWHLGEEGTVLDLMLAIRADEANHRDVNHLAAGMKPGQINPFFDPEAKLDKMLLKYAHDILDKTPEEVKLRTMGPSGA